MTIQIAKSSQQSHFSAFMAALSSAHCLHALSTFNIIKFKKKKKTLLSISFLQDGLESSRTSSLLSFDNADI